VAGHIAQEILREFPLPALGRGGAPWEAEDSHKDCSKNRRKLWALLLYSRVLTWGREFRTVFAISCKIRWKRLTSSPVSQNRHRFLKPHIFAIKSSKIEMAGIAVAIAF